MNSNDLIIQLREGNEHAFRELVKANEGCIASTVIGMLGNNQDAEDVGQETFIRFYKSVHNFKGESSIRTYLVRIAINLCLNEIKKRTRKKLFFVFKRAEELENIPQTAYTEEEKSNRNVVRKAILALEPKDRSVIVLRLIDGYSSLETARILKIPLGTVLSRLSRAQKKLKSVIKKQTGVEYAR